MAACPPHIFTIYFRNLRLNFTPSQLPTLLAIRQPHQTMPVVVFVFSSTPLPGFTGKDFFTTTGSSATLQGVSPALSLLLY